MEIMNLVHKLYSMYVHRYINKNFEQIDKEEFVVLKRCHDWYLMDRFTNKINTLYVKSVVDTTPGHCLLKMLNKERKIQKQHIYNQKKLIL